jgi:hypothetical protein
MRSLMRFAHVAVIKAALEPNPRAAGMRVTIESSAQANGGPPCAIS